MAIPRLIQLRDEYLAKIYEYRRRGKQNVYVDKTWYDDDDDDT